MTSRLTKLIGLFGVKRLTLIDQMQENGIKNLVEKKCYMKTLSTPQLNSILR